jgi:hypothetical protein
MYSKSYHTNLKFFWQSGSGEENFQRFFSCINASRNAFPYCDPKPPPSAQNLLLKILAK